MYTIFSPFQQQNFSFGKPLIKIIYSANLIPRALVYLKSTKYNSFLEFFKTKLYTCTHIILIYLTEIFS